MKTAALGALLELFLQRLSGSAAIEKWCEEKYGKKPWFVVGMDYNKPPTDEECPYIVLVADKKTEGHVETLLYSVAIAWCVCNKAVDNEEGVSKFAGLYEADEFGQLILTEASRALKNATIDTVQYTLDGFTQYPQFPGEMQITVAVPYTMGAGEIKF